MRTYEEAMQRLEEIAPGAVRAVQEIVDDGVVTHYLDGSSAIIITYTGGPVCGVIVVTVLAPEEYQFTHTSFMV